MSFPTYPQEMFEEILSHLSDDISSLKSCTLVSHFFYSIAFRLLFAVIEFHPDTSRNYKRYMNPPKFECFYKVLQESPRAERLASAVKVFKISNGPRPSYYHGFAWDEDYPSWVSKEPDRIGYLLRMMRNLQSLSIMQYGCARAQQNPPPIPDALLRDIERIIMNGSLTSLLLRGVPIRINLLAHCSATLQDLSIGFLSPHQVPSVSLDNSLPLPLHGSSMAQIKKLSFAQYGRELLELMRIITKSRSHSSLSLSELRHIVIAQSASALDLDALEILLSKVSRGPIETLNIDLSWNRSMTTVLSPKALSCVKHLILQSRLPVNITPIIRNIQSGAIIQVIHLIFWLNSPRKIFTTDPQAVGTLEAELLQLMVRVPTLENIIIRVETLARTYYSREDVFNLEREIVGKFTALIGHPSIKFECGHSG
ncbi:hypothetical protein BDQ17DRAFT_165844 [Cyathus striatus]|nr:hypothetical protein BDQ17DRAFT_165844 [Cyathus striatus]